MGVWQGPGLAVPWDWDSQCAPARIHAPAGPFHPLWHGRVLPGCTSPARPASPPCTDTQGGRDGVSRISFWLHPGSPPSTPMGLPRAALPPGSQMGLDCPRTEQVVSGAALSQPQQLPPGSHIQPQRLPRSPHRFCTMFITIQSEGYTVLPIRSLKRMKISMRKSCQGGGDVRS